MCIGSKKNRFNLSLSVGPKKDRFHMSFTVGPKKNRSVLFTEIYQYLTGNLISLH